MIATASASGIAGRGRNRRGKVVPLVLNPRGRGGLVSLSLGVQSKPSERQPSPHTYLSGTLDVPAGSPFEGLALDALAVNEDEHANVVSSSTFGDTEESTWEMNQVDGDILNSVDPNDLMVRVSSGVWILLIIA